MENEYHRCYEQDFLIDSENAPGGIIVYYADGGEEIIHVNQYIVDLFECESVDEFLELVGGSFSGFVYGEDLGAAEDSIWGQVEKRDNLDHINYRIQTKAGRLVNVEDFGRLVEREGERPVFHVFVIETEQRGTIDWLTGLPSMVRFHALAEMGAKTIRGRGDQPVAIALDFVGLKSFNTEYGRDEGDKLLCVFGEVLRKHFGSEACSRFAEDHFYAFASATGIDERIQALFDDFAIANDGRVLPIRAGAYVCEQGDDIISIGFDRAKIACDLDRKTWQSHVLWFTDDMRLKAHLRIHVLDRIDQAIEENWVRPFYQPIVRAATGNVCGEEALARWDDPDYGPLTPDQFIPVLEEAGLLQKLDMHMVDCVLEDFARKRDAGVEIVPVSVNFSLRDLSSLDLAEEVCAKVDAAGVSHDLLRIEFTESAVSDEPELFARQLALLHEAGFQVWMDDFGSGYSSLNMLQNVEFDLVKLDMGLVRDVKNEKACDVVAGVVRVAKKLGVGTLAEGVESEEQAVFLESVGCDMLQGFLYSKPNPPEIVIERTHRGIGMAREGISESAYWTAVCSVDLIDPMANIDARAVDGSMLSEFPAGIMECRDGQWYILRANKAYREFLGKAGTLSLERSSLQVNAIETKPDVDFVDAVHRSEESGMWERIAGRKEYGTGFQFYTRALAAGPDARAYLLTAVPTMLGAALGSYGDVPVAYAVFRAVLSEAGDEVVDFEFVYANSYFYEWGGYEKSSLTGRSYLEMNDSISRAWFPYGYRAAVLGESVRGIVYSPEIGHWLSFSMAPSPVEGCFLFAYTIADDEHREREEIVEDRDTSALIVQIVNAFTVADGFEEGMSDVLAMISDVIHPDRLFIYERGQGADQVTFEWCADASRRQKGIVHHPLHESFSPWDSLADGDSVIYVPDISVVAGIDSKLHEKLVREGVTHMLAVELSAGGKVLGNLVAENYEMTAGIDTARLLETIASFISTSIANQRLLAELEQAGTHDALTGLLNRRGFDGALAARLEEYPEAPYVLGLMDIDDFKLVNDLHGHKMGDEALRAISRMLADVMPADAILGRNGGDEFVIALFGDDAEHADELFAGVADSDLGCEYEGKWYRLSVSIGYAGWPDQARDLKDAYTKADAALYSVKLGDKSAALRYAMTVESQYRSQLGFTPRDIAENVPGAVLVHQAGGNGDILFANDELVDMFECDGLADFMEFTGGAFSNIVHPDDAVRVFEELVGQVSLGDVGAKNFSNFRIVTKGGGVRNVAYNGRLVDVDEVGKVFYVVIIDRDERDSHLWRNGSL